MRTKFFRFIWILLLSMMSISAAQEKDDGISYVFAKKLFNDGLYELAGEHFHQFAEENYQHPKAPESLLLAGKCFLKIANYGKAIQELTYLITRYPTAELLDDAQYSLGQAFEKNNQLEFAAKAYHQVHIFYPKSTLALTSLLQSAKLYSQLRDFAAAEEVLYEVRENYPDTEQELQARLMLAELFIENRSYERAQIELDNLLTITQEGNVNATAMLNRARIEQVMGRTQEAENIYLNMISKYQNYARKDKVTINSTLDEARFELARILSAKGSFEQSNKFLIAIEDLNQGANSLELMADNYFNLKSYNEARTNYERIRSISTDSLLLAQSSFKIGICLLKMEDFNNSNLAFINVLSLSNDTEEYEKLRRQSYLNLSENCLKLRSPQLAIKYLNEYREKYKSDPYSAFIIYKIASIFQNEIKNFERAIRSYYELIDGYPQNKLVDDAQFALAQCFEKKMDYLQAINEYQYLISHYPASEFCQIAQKRIEYLNDYVIVDKSVVNHIGKLMQQFITLQSDSSADFKFGQIYFEEIKDYRSAIDYLKKAYSSNQKSNHLGEVIFYLGRAHHLLSLKFESPENERQAFADSAVAYYSMLQNNFNQSKWADDAAFFRIELLIEKAATVQDSSLQSQVKDLLTNFKYVYPNSEFLNQVNLWLGEMLLKDGVSSSIDSLDISNCFNSVVDSSEDSNYQLQAQYNLGVLLHQCGNDSAALQKLEVLKASATVNYNNCRAIYLMSEIFEATGEYSLAEKYLTEVIDEYFYSSFAEEAELRIGRLKVKQKKYSEAAQVYEKLFYAVNHSEKILQDRLIDNQSQIDEILYHYGMAHFHAGSITRAINLFQEYLHQHPNGTKADEVLYTLAEIFNNKLNLDQDRAISYMKQLLKYFPSSTFKDSTLIRLADLYFNKNEYMTANEYYELAIESSAGTNPYPFSQKIICLYRSDQVNSANELLSQFKKQFRSSEDFISNLMLEKGNYHLKNKDLKVAEDIFKKVRSDFKKSSDGIRADFLLGKLYFVLNKDEEAMELMTRLIEKYPDHEILAEVYLSLGNYYYLQVKQVENALLAFKKVLELKKATDYHIQIGMNNLIRCYSDLRMRDQALSLIKLYLERFPKAEDLFEKKILMGILLYELNEYDRALSWLRKLKHEADFENEPRIQYWIGECYFGKGDFKRAVSEYLKIVYLSKPTKLNWKVTAQFQAGVAYLKAGEPQNAKVLFNRIILEQGADSVFGKPAQKKIEEIENMIGEDYPRM